MLYFKIKGTLGITVDEGKVSFSLYPDAAYCCPEKKYVTLYPKNLHVEEHGEGDHSAWVVKLEENKYSFLELLEPDKNFSTLRDSLVQLALQSKVVDLFVKKEGNHNKPCITGFNYPAR